MVRPASAPATSLAIASSHFVDPTPEQLTVEAAIGAAYEAGRALYGDEDGDAWLAALESGEHRLCRLQSTLAAR